MSKVTRPTLIVLLLKGIITTLMRVHVGFRSAQKDGIIGVGLDMLFEILRAFEGLAAKVALVWLQGDMYAHVRGDVVALDRGCLASAPLTGEVEVVGRLATDMAFAYMVL